MEKPLLNDPDHYPHEEILSKTLGNKHQIDVPFKVSIRI